MIDPLVSGGYTGAGGHATVPPIKGEEHVAEAVRARQGLVTDTVDAD